MAEGPRPESDRSVAARAGAYGAHLSDAVDGAREAVTVGQLQQLFGSAPTAVVAFDDDGKVSFANTVAAVTFASTAEELIGAPIDDLITDSEERSHVDLLAAMRELTGPRYLGPGLDLYARRRGGALVPVDVRMIPVLMADGSSWRIAGFDDVSERRETERRAAMLRSSYLALAKLNQAVVRATEADELYRETCRIAVEEGGYLGALVVTRGADGTGHAAAASGLGIRFANRPVVFDRADGSRQTPTAVALWEGRAFVSSDYLHDPRAREWREQARDVGIRSVAAMPLRVDGATVAALTLYSSEVGRFDEGIGELVEQVAINVSHALTAFAARADLERVLLERRELSRRLVTAQETERRSIANDLHDDTIQTLAAMSIWLGGLRREVGVAVPTALPLLEKMEETLSRSTTNLRELTFELEPESGQGTWAEAIREAAGHTFEGEDISWTLVSPEDVGLPPIERAQGLRIVKEALINVRKHPDASTVTVTVSVEGPGVAVTITDDGVGIAAEELEELEELGSPSGHRGVSSMRDRATAVGGWARLEPCETGGTTLRFWVPDSSTQA